MVGAVDHQHDRALVDRVASLGADARLPVLRQERHEIGDLLLELMSRGAGERRFAPDHAGSGVERFDREPRCVRVGEVGQHQHGRGMLAETVGHLLQRKAHVLEADLLADHVERHMRETVVHCAQHAQHHSAVADAGIEHAHGRRARMDVGELERDAIGDHPLFAAGIDEEEIFLPVVEEAEVALRVVVAGRHQGVGRRRDSQRRGQGCS